jgi:predicted ATPase
VLQRLGEAYRQVLDDHFALIFGAVRRAGGTVANTMGDGVFATFATAPLALEAALDAQRCLVAHAWPATGMARVRMGIHTGLFAAEETEHVGLDVHRAARICSAAHGGQVLISGAARSACAGRLPSDVLLRDLGRHLLKDLDEPEHLFQATVPGLLAEFPPPRSRHVRPHNLPSEVTEFIGRESEIADARRLLATNRLLTLAGPGGTGKTRLALRLANVALPDFADGVYFVPLEAIRDAALVDTAIARALGIPDTEGRSVLDVLIEQLASKRLLLVLDNFEQVLGASRSIGRLLAGCPELRVLITTRSVLRIDGERIFEVLPFALPPSHLSGDPELLARISSVDLFVRRAAAARPGFALTAENASAVAQIVTRLEGLPLAIELAAVRTRLFPPEMLAKRLEQPFTALSTGMRGSSEHHRTLRDAIAWSYDLLERADQAVFRRLGVFVGGFTIEAAETVAGSEPGENAIESVASLVDQSLLRSHVLHGEARFSMLEMIREFALEQLDAAGERARIAERHLAYVLQLAEEAAGHLTGRAELVAIDTLTADQGNIRAALQRCVSSSDAETGLRICSAIWRFWHAAGQIGEGRQWLQTLLAIPGPPAAVRAGGLTGLAGLAYWQGDYATALAVYEEALSIYRAERDRMMEAETLYAMSTTRTWSGDPVGGGQLADEALAGFIALGARDKIGEALMAQGFARWMKNDLAGARPLWEQSITIARETGDRVEAATKCLALASIKFRQGEEGSALADALAALRELVELKHVTYTIMALDFVAALTAQRNPAASVRLAGAAAKLRATLGGGMRPEASGLESARVVAGRMLDAATLQRLWNEGEDMKLEQAVNFALEYGRLLLEHAAPLPVH